MRWDTPCCYQQQSLWRKNNSSFVELGISRPLGRRGCQELRRKAHKAKRKQKLWTQEEIDLMMRKSNNDINILLENYSQFNLDQRNYK